LLGGIDLLVFTGGIGQHSAYIRQKSTEGLDALGLRPEMIQVVTTQEELQMARHCRTMLAAHQPT
jgi:acetate kinase